MAIFENDDAVAKRLFDPTPLTTEEIRALTTKSGWTQYGFFVQRVQIELALHQLAAIKKFDKVSGRLMTIGVIASCVQIALGAIALFIALIATQVLPLR